MELPQDLEGRVNNIIATLKRFAKETQARNKRIGVVKKIIKEREFSARERSKRMQAFLSKCKGNGVMKTSVRKFQNKESSDLKERVHVEVVKEYSLKLQKLSQMSAASSKTPNEEICKAEFAQPQTAKEIDLPFMPNGYWEQDVDVGDLDFASDVQGGEDVYAP
ncbi:hypothetical protein NDN08_005367 [Rhodosorus marinus]|uniref:Uncharacterized protein n=1 Tax=Rhodosorus marinus TaxID=101924 RepID=A0AAV8V4F2_9RHOD|nr:hypothetical protein NDN08_005367 [Rhodosorus marinus]